MSQQKMIVPGFGVGACFGVPTTLGLAPTSTLSITAGLVGQYHVASVATGITLQYQSTTGGVTATWAVLAGAPGRLFLDGVSMFAVSTTTSVSLVFINT